MKVVTAEQIRDLDRRAMAGSEPDGTGGIPGVVLMENAGRAVVAVMEREYGPLRGKRVAVFCGTGNNGGDGFVIARYLHLARASVNVYAQGRPEALKGDALLQYSILTHSDLTCYWTESRDLTVLQAAIMRGRPEIIVDALLGTGIKGAPKPGFADDITIINRAGLPVVAVDIPSGVDADTGATPGDAVRATHTVTFAYPKLGLYLYPGAEHVGKLHIADIGYDWESLNVVTPYRVITLDDLRASLAGTGLLSPRRGETNKGDYGHVGIIAGSRGMVGAPALVARGAQRVGAGLVTVLTAESAQAALAVKLDEQMTRALPEADGALSEAAFAPIAEWAQKASVLCVGPGLTTHPQTVRLVQRLLTELDMPLVLDADGLNALAQAPDSISRRKENARAPLVLTPHPGEAARLLGTDISGIQSNRIASALELAKRYRALVVLKGRHTLVADANGQIRINTTGNPGMATGGMGDTLTGIVGGLLAQWIAPQKHDRNGSPNDSAAELSADPLDVVALAVHVHGRAGDLAARSGQAGLVAGDVITHLPSALQGMKDAP